MKRWFVVLTVVVLVLSWTTVFAASPGDVLIVEVGADPASAAGITEPAGEFIEIYNNTASTINLNGWTINDNGATTITLPSIDLEAGRILVIIADPATLGTPNGYGCAGSPNTPLYHQPAAWFTGNLSNTGDRVILADNAATQIDALSYGTDTTIFNPSAPDAFDNSGATLQRETYNTNFTDTDTADDWNVSVGAGSPCDVGPNALTLRSLRASSGPGALPAAGVVALSMAGVALALRRKR